MGASEDRELISLRDDVSARQRLKFRSLLEAALRLQKLQLFSRSGSRTFFIIPAFLLEKVMCRRDLSWMNLMSIFLLSRPGLSSSSSSSSAPAALVRERLTPRASVAWPLPVARASSCAEGEWLSFGSVISPIVVVLSRFSRISCNGLKEVWAVWGGSSIHFCFEVRGGRAKGKRLGGKQKRKNKADRKLGGGPLVPRSSHLH